MFLKVQNKPNNELVIAAPSANERILLIDTRSIDDANNSAKGSWTQYGVTSKKFIINIMG